MKPLRASTVSSTMRPLSLAALVALAAASPPRAHADETAPWGAIRGSVKLEGAPPASTRPAPTDPYCAKAGPGAEEVSVADGKVRDVLVRIKVGTAGKHAAPAEPAVIQQQGCMYRPRVLGLVAGQKLVVMNADKTMHNVHAYLGGETEFNLAQPQGGRPVERAVGAPGDVLALRCDVHPWMRAFAVVLDHPYFATTGADGAYLIGRVPEGQYVVEAWHPVLGLRSVTVEVRHGATSTADFTFGGAAK